MRLLKGSLLITAYIVLPVASAYALPHLPISPPPLPVPGLKAPEFDVTEIVSGIALAAGAAFFFIDRFRRKR